MPKECLPHLLCMNKGKLKYLIISVAYILKLCVIIRNGAGQASCKLILPS